MTGKVFVTAGPHEVGYTWKERPARRQDVWQPAQRDSQEVHMREYIREWKRLMKAEPDIAIRREP